MDRLIAKLCYKVELEAISPLSIGTGLNEITDHDIIRYKEDNKPFVPSSSIAGSLFSKNERTKEFFGIYDDVEKISQSPLFISNGEFTSISNISIRDGIKVNYDTKATIKGAKYDSEIVEAGSCFSFNLEFTVRDSNKNTLDEATENILDVISHINSGDFKLGSKQNRGFGRLKVNNVYYTAYTNNEIDCDSKYIKPLKGYLDHSWKNMNERIDVPEAKSIYPYVMSAECNLAGGLSIRKYVARFEKHLNYECIKANGKTIIPASSLNGSLLNNAYKIALELKLVKSLEEFERLEDNFVFTKREDPEFKKGASRYIVDEASIEGGNDIQQTRSSVDRFTGGARDNSLFTEVIHFNGTTRIGVSFKNGTAEWIVGLFYLAMLDLTKGYRAIGGQTAVGRGILLADTIEINEEPIDSSNKYVDALYNYIIEEGQNEN